MCLHSWGCGQGVIAGTTNKSRGRISWVVEMSDGCQRSVEYNKHCHYRKRHFVSTPKKSTK